MAIAPASRTPSGHRFSSLRAAKNGLTLQGKQGQKSINMAAGLREYYNELAAYTLAHPDPSFIHQYVVDAHTAQCADSRTKPIALYFALVGLFLHIEKGYSGKDVQRVHMRLGKEKREWPAFLLPGHRGGLSIVDVVQTPAGPQRDEMIEKWSASVWEAYRESHERVAEALTNMLGERKRGSHEKR